MNPERTDPTFEPSTPPNMKRALLSIAVTALGATGAYAQRYLSEVFTDAQVDITSNVVYGTNFRFFPPVNWADPDVPTEIGTLHTIVSGGGTIPAGYYDPSDTSTVVKVQALRMDIYEPDQTDDSLAQRPVILYIPTGNLLPPPVNGSPTGSKTDSSVVESCKRLARRGFVAIAVEYRHGWNPLDTTLEGRRGTLLNAVYRAIHDVRECTRKLREDAASLNTWGIDPDKIVLMGEGTGGYIVQASATLDEPGEIFIEKFLPDIFDPNTSYVDTVQVGNFEGFCTTANPFCLSLYQPNGETSEINMTVNLGGALADTSWLDPGDVPSVSFHTVFDPFAPFTEGIVIVPTTGEQVLPLQGSNLVQQLQNDFGNNAAFATLPGGDPYTDRARALYGTTHVHTGSTVTILPTPEGLFPFVTPDWPAAIPGTLEEASPWQWWDPANPLANVDLDGPGPGTVTTGQASQASNPNFSGAKGRAYIDTIMGYGVPRIVCVLQIGPCSLVGIDENGDPAGTLSIMPNPASTFFTVQAPTTVIEYRLFDVNGREVRHERVNRSSFQVQREGLEPGAYVLRCTAADAIRTAQVMVE